MDTIIINNNKYVDTTNSTKEKDLDVVDDIDDLEAKTTSDTTATPSPPTTGGSSTTERAASATSGNGQDSRHNSHRDNVSSFLKFSIQNILQHAAVASGAGAAAAVAAAASANRRSNDLIQADAVAAAMTDLDMKRAMGSLPFW